METAIQNKNYHYGLLHFMHLLVMVDGVIDEREEKAILQLKQAEKIPESIFRDFRSTITTKSEREIYETGVKHLNACNDIEKLCAFIHLFRLAEADENIHIKEVRFLLYSLKATQVSFEDVEYAIKLSKAAPPLRPLPHRQKVA